MAKTLSGYDFIGLHENTNVRMYRPNTMENDGCHGGMKVEM